MRFTVNADAVGSRLITRIRARSRLMFAAESKWS